MSIDLNKMIKKGKNMLNDASMILTGRELFKSEKNSPKGIALDMCALAGLAYLDEKQFGNFDKETQDYGCGNNWEKHKDCNPLQCMVALKGDKDMKEALKDILERRTKLHIYKNGKTDEELKKHYREVSQLNAEETKIMAKYDLTHKNRGETLWKKEPGELELKDVVQNCFGLAGKIKTVRENRFPKPFAKLEPEFCDCCKCCPACQCFGKCIKVCFCGRTNRVSPSCEDSDRNEDIDHTGCDAIYGLYLPVSAAKEEWFNLDNAHAIFISFRGTEKVSYNDWDTNFRINKCYNFNNSEEDAKVDKCTIHFQESNEKDPSKIQLHEGFCNQFKALYNSPQFKDFFKKTLENYPDGIEIFISGHSLGGGTAQIAAFYLANKYKKANVKLYTFGAPRAGNRTFKEEFQKLKNITASYRFADMKDVIPVSNSGLFFNKFDFIHLPGGGERREKDAELPPKPRLINGKNNIDRYSDSFEKVRGDGRWRPCRACCFLLRALFDMNATGHKHNINTYHQKIGHCFSVGIPATKEEPYPDSLYWNVRWEPRVEKPAQIWGIIIYFILTSYMILSVMHSMYWRSCLYVDWNCETEHLGNNMGKTQLSIFGKPVLNHYWTDIKKSWDEHNPPYTLCVRRANKCDSGKYSELYDGNGELMRNDSRVCKATPNFVYGTEGSKKYDTGKIPQACCPTNYKCYKKIIKVLQDSEDDAPSSPQDEDGNGDDGAPPPPSSPQDDDNDVDDGAPPPPPHHRK